MLRAFTLPSTLTPLVFVIALAGCSADRSGTGPVGGPDGSGPVSDAGGGDGGGATGDGSAGRDGGADPDTGDDDGGSDNCKTECAPDDCGQQISDGCGGYIDCPAECPDGQGCGLQRPSKCDFPPPDECVPASEEALCAGLCGAVSDGCSGVVKCSAANGGRSCASGEHCQGGQCVEASGSCTPLEATAACAGKCGFVSDGCADLIDCSGRDGSLLCGEGERCATAGAHANTCEEVPPASCTPRTAADACAGTCGIVDDGCGAPLDCAAEGFACAGGESCKGTPAVCTDDVQPCEPSHVATACAGKCGSVPDGCGGAHACGNTCALGESCGGGGMPNVCFAPGCEPLTFAQACSGEAGHQSCGTVPDGCNGTLTCDGCPDGEGCGLAGPNLCGVPECEAVAVEVACAGKCGTVPDGCGGSYACHDANGGVTCSGDAYCGANAANECGEPPDTCTPLTCADLGHACGLAADGCGDVINCWPGCDEDDAECAGTCGDAAACLADFDSGAQACVAGAPGCSGSLCDELPTSCGDSPTRLTGTVRTPGRPQGDGSWVNQLPVPNALVYIPAEPNSALPDVFEGVDASDPLSCGRCADEQLVSVGESVLAAAVTNALGEFTLEGRIPVGSDFHLVVKVGKWRRVVNVPAGTASACESRALDHDYTRLAGASNDGLSGTHLPKIAVSTGRVDEMECVFRNMGFAEREFTVPSEDGRVHMYRSNGARMMGAPEQTHACRGFFWCPGIDDATDCDDTFLCSWQAITVVPDLSVADSELFGSQERLNDYDLVVWDCEGSEHRHGAEAEARVASYVNAGGRMFASHYSYVWVENDPSLSDSSQWGPTSAADSDTGLLSMPSGDNQRAGANGVKSTMLRDWLDYQGALSGTNFGSLQTPASPQFTITDPRDRAGAAVGAASDEWVYRTTGDGPRVQQLSFNTPYGSDEDALCGRVAYSGFHVAAADNDDSNDAFPGVCDDGELSAQEKVLAFMLFDLATCVSAGDPPQPPECTPLSVATACPADNDACGFVPDGCGGVVDCGGCGAGYYCAGSQCRPQECTPASCADLGFNCGAHADGCGGIARNTHGELGCGECSAGQFCGLGGPGLCGSASCAPLDFAVACPSGYCGLVSDGCGGTHDCGGCSDGDVCGGGGANVCGPGSCVPSAKADACVGLDCGLVSDGCGDTHACGSCGAPESCGGGGAPNVCGTPSCTPLTAGVACDGLECGWVGDGCGGALQCGTCADGGVCGGAGPNLCGAACTPTTCSAAGANCGVIADGCGGVLSCGQCQAGQTCGAAGPNVCGSGPPCEPTSCADSGFECGLSGDGCGHVLDCGTCTAPGESCGGAGVPNECGVGTGGCDALTCDDYSDVECGPVSDGCGGLLDCGGCGTGSRCERNACVVILI